MQKNQHVYVARWCGHGSVYTCQCQYDRQHFPDPQKKQEYINCDHSAGIGVQYRN